MIGAWSHGRLYRLRHFGLVGALALCVVPGCSTHAPSDPVRYLLTGERTSSAAPADPGYVLRLSRLELAPFLRGEGIVMQTGESTIVQARHHLWAEPLSGQLQRDLRGLLADELPAARVVPADEPLPSGSDDALTLAVRVERFQGRFDGDAVVAGDWHITDTSDRVVGRGHFKKAKALTADGYEPLVGSLAAAWRAAVEEVADGVRQQAP